MSALPKTIQKPVSPLVAGIAYGTALFCIGFVLGTIRTLLITPSLGREGAVLVELPLMALAAWFLAQSLMKRWSIRPNWLDRLVVGGVALFVGMGPELALGMILQKKNLGAIIAFMLLPENQLGLTAQLMVFGFPLIQLVVPQRAAS